MKQQQILGINIGGTKCATSRAAASGNGNGDITGKTVFPTETDRDFDHALQNIYRCMDAELDRERDVTAIGISCGGPLDSKKGVIMSPTTLLGWDHIPIVALMEERYGIKTAIQNDANTCMPGEWKYGAGREYSNVIFLIFGTGMGAGLILDNRLYAGISDMACEVYRICGQYLGKALAMLVDVLNPAVIILGSICGRAQALIEPSMRKVIERETLIYSRSVCKIIPAGLGESIGDYAVLSVAAYQL